MDSLEEERMSGYSCQVVKDARVCTEKAEIMAKKPQSLVYYQCYHDTWCYKTCLVKKMSVAMRGIQEDPD